MSRRYLITIALVLVAVGLVGIVAFHLWRTGEQPTIDSRKVEYALVLEGAGASFQYPQIVQWSGLFRERTGITVNYQSVGSGAGQRMFLIDRVVHFAASDPPLTRSQWENYRGMVLQVPWIMGAVVVVYNIPGANAPLNLTGEVLARIYLGEIVYWDDPAILELNPQLVGKLPRREIIAVHRSDSSGTTKVFTQFLHKSAPNVWPRELVGMQIDWPVDRTGRGVGAKGNEGVVAVVVQTPYSIGYVEFSYALEHGLAYAAVMNAAGRFVLPSAETIQAAALGITLPESPLDDFSHTLEEVVFSPHSEAYPIATLAYGIFWARYDDPAVARSIARLLRWIAEEGYNYMVRGYVPPPPEAVRLLLKVAEIVEKGISG